MAKNFSFRYTICEQSDEKLFQKQCRAFEKKFLNLRKGKLLEDVDGSSYQIYYHTAGEFVVANDCYIGCLYVESDFDLLPYFEAEN